MRQLVQIGLHVAVGVILALLSTFVGERDAFVAYSDIMGCETGCRVIATGWPLIFVTDYLGMSVVGSASIMEVWFAADRFAWPPFLMNVAFWGIPSVIADLFLSRARLVTPLGQY